MQLDKLKKLGLLGRSAVLILTLNLLACGGPTIAVKSSPLEEPIATTAVVDEKSVVVPEETSESVLVDPSPDRLVMAARYGQAGALKYLLDGGMNVNARDAYGNTALNAAASNEQTDMVELLLAHDADVNIANNEELTALMGVASKGNHELAYRLVALGAKVNAANNDGETALFMAVKYGHYKTVMVLLKGGANPNLSNTLSTKHSNSGYTPLIYAATHGLGKADATWAEIAQLLLENGANPNLKNSHGDAALQFAQSRNDDQMIKILKQAGAKDDSNYIGLDIDEALLRAASLGDTNKMQQVIANGANPNFSDKNGVTPLLAAAYEGRLNALEILLQAKAEVNFVPSGLRQFALARSYAPHTERALMEAASRGDTGLIAAVRQGHVDEAEYLLAHGARIDLSNQHGEMALFVAVSNGNIDMVKLLLEHGSDANAIEQDNRRNRLALAKYVMGKNSVLGVAVDKGHQEIARMLVEKGADINYRGFMGKTALFTAVEKGRSQLVADLLEQYADPNIATLAGITPLMEAARMGNHRIVAGLLSSKANVNVIEKPELGYAREIQGGGSTSMTALMLAAQGGHDRVVEQLLEVGAEIEIHNTNGENALSIAADSGYDYIASLLSDNQTDSVILSVVK